MHRYSEVLNLPVICAGDGSKAGVVKDILFSIRDRKAKALLLEQKGLSARKRVVLLSKLLNLGGGAVIIDNRDCIEEMDSTAFKNAFGDDGSLIGTKVYSKAGDEVGVARDVIFDLHTGRIEGFEISDGLLQDVMKGRKLLPLLGKVELGREIAVVDTEAVEEMKETGGGLKNKLSGLQNDS
ncbi:MAG: photosystem reaction center subunit H [Clostridiaceae bacterium]|nr:photosystem reaction center subunit H [Clostridiaceae bacterium]